MKIAIIVSENMSVEEFNTNLEPILLSEMENPSTAFLLTEKPYIIYKFLKNRKFTNIIFYLSSSKESILKYNEKYKIKKYSSRNEALLALRHDSDKIIEFALD